MSLRSGYSCAYHLYRFRCLLSGALKLLQHPNELFPLALSANLNLRGVWSVSDNLGPRLGRDARAYGFRVVNPIEYTDIRLQVYLVIVPGKAWEDSARGAQHVLRETDKPL